MMLGNCFALYEILELILYQSFAEIVGHLERQYDDILAEESRIKRNPRFRDNRVHALLYFITPTGHGFVTLHLRWTALADIMLQSS